MLSKDVVQTIAQDWVEAWNSHDLDQILSHYAEDVTLVSPIAAKILENSLGSVTGKTALAAYFKRGLETYPNLRFHLIDVVWGVQSIIFYYSNQDHVKVGEFVEVNDLRKIYRVVANYGL